jgi:hypothetical protein
VSIVQESAVWANLACGQSSEAEILRNRTLRSKLARAGGKIVSDALVTLAKINVHEKSADIFLGFSCKPYNRVKQYWFLDRFRRLRN